MDWTGIFILISTFVVLLALGVPIAYSIGISGILTMLVTIDLLPAVTTMAQRMATGLDSFTLLAIPFFIFAGQLMNRGGIAIRLIAFAKVLVGRLPGGLAFVNVIANMLFGAISGSATASASAIGTIIHPRMKADGYDENFSAAINSSSATTGLIIPPSNILIVYSLASGGVSISALFIAGYIPGIIMGLFLMAVGAVYAYRKKYPIDERIPFKQAMVKLWDAIPSLLLLVIVIGGLIAGYFTATEASAIAVLYCLILAFIYKELKLKDLPDVILKTISTTAIVMFLIATSIGLSWIMSYENIPQTVSEGLLNVSNNPVIILLVINLILLFVGTFMDMTPAVLIFTPIFLPIVTQQLGMNPIHFGIILIMNLCVGLITPPVGTVLFVGCSVANVKIQSVIKPLIPMFVAMIVSLFLVTYIPKLSLWLPGLFGFLNN
jgi:tripartite ATP-independent transporter DctM subunit